MGYGKFCGLPVGLLVYEWLFILMCWGSRAVLLLTHFRLIIMLLVCLLLNC